MKSIFVSSTFRDMHFERDVLNRRVGAKLNRYLAAHNQSVRLLDLRWGVDTSELSEEEATCRVLKVCFDTVEACKPYIIILLGDRYGYIPGEDGLSVTHMEILRGALENTEPEHVFVYLRQTDYAGMPEQLRQVYTEQNPQAMERLEALKAELRQTFPARCRTYQAHWSEQQQLLVSDEFETMVYEDLARDLEESLGLVSYRSELHRQLSENEELLSDRLTYAYQDPVLLQQRVEQILSGDKPYGIIGQAGAGKSVYMSLLCASLQKQGHSAYILFCGDNAFSASVRNGAEAVLYALTMASGENYDFEQNALATYDELLQLLIRQREKVTGKTYILLDAVDKCEEGMVAFLLWCSRFLSDVILPIFSSQESEKITESRQSFRLSNLVYDRRGLEGMANSLLKQHGKTVNSALILQLCQKVTTPLQLNVLLLRLINLNSSDFAAIEKRGGGIVAINLYLQDLIDRASSDEERLLADYLMTLLDGSSVADFALMVLSFLVFSDRGLSETDLQNLIGVTQLSWVQMDYMEFLEQYAFLIRIRENGRVDISHDVIRRAYRRLMGKQQKAICSILADYFFEAEEPTVEQVAAFFSAAKLGKLARPVVAYLVKHHHILSAMEQTQNLRARQLRKSVAELYLQDSGEFLSMSVSNCKTMEDVAYLQGALCSSLISLNDYLSNETIFKILQLCLAIPTKLESFPADLARMELMSCERFLHRHKVEEDPKIKGFLEQCRQQIDRRGKKPAVAGNAVEQLMAVLKDDAEDITQRVMALEQLCSLGRKQAQDPQKSEQTRKLLLTLVTFMEQDRQVIDPNLRDLTMADVYTSLGVLCKTTRQWEEGIDWDQKSEQIYRAIYERMPTPDIFRKYRARVYNVANIVEAWAMDQKDNRELWQRTCQCYARVYDLELQAVAQGLPERELALVASSILSYGTALCNSGQLDEGQKKFREGMNLILEVTANNPRPELHLDLCMHQMECAYQLCCSQQYEAAEALCMDIGQTISLVIAQGDQNHKKTLWQYAIAFCNRNNEFQAKLAQAGEYEPVLVLYRMTDRIYEVLLPLEDPGVRANIMVTKRNIGNTLMQKEDYEGAYQAYSSLLALVKQYDLADPGRNGKYNDRATLALASVLVRSMLCLEKQNRTSDLATVLETVPDWAKYICSRTRGFAGDPPRILYMMAVELSQQHSPMVQMLIMMAYDALHEDGYDPQQHPGTVTLVEGAAKKFGGSEARE